VIEVSALSLRRIASAKGFEVIQSELLWVWLPAAAVGVVLVVLRKKLRLLIRGSGGREQ